MKTIISSTGNSTDAQFDLRFGRAGWFCLLDEETGNTKFIKNGNEDGSHTAGSRASEKAIELGARKVISGDFGSTAREILDKFNIQMVIIPDDNLTIAEIIQKIK